MALEEIKTLNVSALMAPDAVCCLWAIVPMLPHTLEVLGAWGFEYRSHFVWAKNRVGMGRWNRNQHELLLIGARGDVPCPAPGTQFSSLIEAPIGRHSEKPSIFREMIERAFPNAPKLELFARGLAAPGWTTWGNEAIQPGGHQ
jgi:N6-adenosine-specific RNA methylase IME4